LEELCFHLKKNLNLNNMCIILDNTRIHKVDEFKRITSYFEYIFKFLSPYSYLLKPMNRRFQKLNLL
jgi:hypothetical protein